MKFAKLKTWLPDVGSGSLHTLSTVGGTSFQTAYSEENGAKSVAVYSKMADTVKQLAGTAKGAETLRWDCYDLSGLDADGGKEHYRETVDAINAFATKN